MPSRTEAHDAGPGTTGNSPTAPGTDAVRRRRPEEGRTGSRRPKKTARRPPTRKGFVRMRVEGGPVGESEGRWGPQVPEAGKTRERAGEYPEGHEGNPERTNGKSGRLRKCPRREPVRNRERGGGPGKECNTQGTEKQPVFSNHTYKSSPEGSDSRRALPFFTFPALPCCVSAFTTPRPSSLHPSHFALVVAPPFSFTPFHAPSPPLPSLHGRRHIFPFGAFATPKPPFRLNVRPLFVSLSSL